MSFTYLFYQHIMFRHSCGKCHFCNTKRPSDITIADFWGWQKTAPNINKDDKGVSLVLVNTEKGRKLFEAIRNDLIVIPAELENCLQPNLQHPSAFHSQYKDFEKDYKEKGFVYIMNRYGNLGWRYQVRSLARKIKNRVNKIIRNITGIK